MPRASFHAQKMNSVVTLSNLYNLLQFVADPQLLFIGCLPTAHPLEEQPEGADWAVWLPFEGFSNAYEACFPYWGKNVSPHLTQSLFFSIQCLLCQLTSHVHVS